MKDCTNCKHAKFQMNGKKRNLDRGECTVKLPPLPHSFLNPSHREYRPIQRYDISKHTPDNCPFHEQL